MEDILLQNLSDVLEIPVTEIDTDSTFIHLGGTSLSAIQLVKACKRDGISLSISNILGMTSITQLPFQAVSLEPDTPLTTDNESEASSSKTDTPASSISTPETLTGHLTEMQLSFMAGSEKHPGVNIITHYEEYHAHDIPLMKQAWRSVIEAEPIFRATIDLSEGQGFLIEGANATFEWREVIVGDEPAYNLELSKQTSRSHLGTWFEVVTLDAGNPEDRRSTIIWRVHHALMDGYSAHLLLEKVRRATLGERVQAGLSCIRVLNDLETFRIQNMNRGNQFWSIRNSKFIDCVGELSLPTSNNIESTPNDVETCTVNYSTNELTRCASKAGVTVAAIHHAAWALLLATYLDADNIVFGAVLSGRSLPIQNIESVAGSMVNALPFHVKIDRQKSTQEFLREILRNLNHLADFQWTTSENGLSRQYSSLLAMQYEFSIPAESSVSPLRMWSRTQSDMPFSVLIEEAGNVHFQFNSTKFNRRAVKIMAECYIRFCDLLQVPDKSMEDCLNEVVPDHHREVLMRYGNCFSENTIPSSISDDLVSLFEAAAKANPDNTAVQKDTQILSYSNMNMASDDLAAAIAERTNEGDVVCVYADQTPEWIIAIFGVLKARCVYCPISPTSPVNYIQSIFNSAEPKLFITPHMEDKLTDLEISQPPLVVEEVLRNPRMAGVDYAGRGSTTPTANAYLCFTSGSTGTPKGVMCSHEGLVAFQKDITVRLLARPGWRISQVMSPAFDGSIHEIFSALSYGATLVLPYSKDPFRHVGEVDSALFTPSVAAVIDPSDFPNLVAVYLVGEPIPPRIANKWASHKQLYNMYGPTEATGGATIAKLLPNEPVTIGGPNPSSRIYILNSNHQLSPPGVVGELFLAGVQVARGYINRPDETKKRFLKDTILPNLASMMYQTGDRGYWNEKGEIVLLGRADRQIKLRGFRLDLNDLETRLERAYPVVTSAAVTVTNSQLIALVKPKNIDMAKYRQALEESMPRYSIPHHIIPVDEFPKTAIGKLDYKAIENMPLSVHTTDKTHVSRASEKRIADVWRDLLGLPDNSVIDPQSNFLDLGGHSLLQLLMAGRLSKLFGYTIPPILVIESQNLHDLAQEVESLRQSQSTFLKLQRDDPLGLFELSPIELEWYQKYELDVSSSAFNVSLAYAFSPEVIDRDRLTEAWNTVLRRHRILRTRYVKQRRGDVKRRYADNPPRVQRVLNVNIWKETHKIFNVNNDDLIRVTISKDRLIIVASHIICDLTTIQILLQEVTSVYQGIPLLQDKHEYMEATVWSNHIPPCDLDFWNDYLKDAPLSNRSPSPTRNDYRGSTALCQVPVHVFHEMEHLVETTKLSYHQLALAAVALAMNVDTEHVDLVLGGPYLNRKSERDMNTVGLYLEPLPIRVQYDPASSGESYLESVKRQSQSAVAHAIPWNQLLEDLQVKPDFPDHPLMDTMVTFHDDRHAKEPLGLDSVEKLLIWTNGAKFKLMVEFTAVSSDNLLLRLEYDHNCYTETEIRKIQELIITGLLYLSLEIPYHKLKSHLWRIKEGPNRTSYKPLPFGVTMQSL